MTRTRTRKPVYRASPCLAITWQAGVIIAENYFLHTRAEISALVPPLLDALQTWKTVERLKEELPGWSGSVLRQTLTTLAKARLVHTAVSDYASEQRVGRAWEPWSPWAGAFHFATRDLEYQPAHSVDLLFRRLQTKEPQADAFKEYAGASRIALPSPKRLSVPFDSVMLRRRSVRTYAASPIGLEDLATIMYYTWGQTGWIRSRVFGNLVTKTSPSGGARHPIEAYVVARRIDGVKPGIYHYAVRDHALERLSGLPGVEAISKAFPGQPWIAGAPAIFVMTAVIARSMWKYRFGRTYRVLLMDAGHVGQTFYLVAAAIGLGPVTTGAFHDTSLERLLHVDGVTEPALYVAVLGRPSDGGDPFTRSRGTRSSVRLPGP
jgi:SagB-type dehydrogenase family enzyme